MTIPERQVSNIALSIEHVVHTITRHLLANIKTLAPHPSLSFNLPPIKALLPHILVQSLPVTVNLTVSTMGKSQR